MEIKPIGQIGPTIVFKGCQGKDCQPLKPQAVQPIKEDTFEKTETVYDEGIKKLKAEKEKLAIEFKELIEKPGKYTKGVENDNNGNNKNKGFK